MHLVFRDVVLGGDEGSAGYPDHALVRGAAGTEGRQICDLVGDVDADHRERAVVKFKNVRRIR